AAAVVLPGSGLHGAKPLTVHELAYRAAAAASAQGNVPANHWVYWREQEGHGAKAHVWQVWTTADGRKGAYRFHGKVYPISLQLAKQVPHHRAQYIGQPEVTVAPSAGWGVTYRSLLGIIPIRYADLSKLPGSPHALVRYLGHLRLPKSGPPAARAFRVIVELIQTYVMPPQLTAELYRALADIPGVTVDNHAIDVAGRHGVGFAFDISPGSGTKEELVLNRHSYHLRAVQIVRDKRGPNGRVVIDSGTAILRMALVNGPGVLPEGTRSGAGAARPMPRGTARY
ncbi:MAG: CU044_5270 family protein, partial [Streptosporangiaceae bacterium]